MTTTWPARAKNPVRWNDGLTVHAWPLSVWETGSQMKLLRSCWALGEELAVVACCPMPEVYFFEDGTIQFLTSSQYLAR